MKKYKIIVSSYRQSGKHYSTGDSIGLGFFDEYPSDLIYHRQNEIEDNLDKFCGLTEGSVQQNELNVLIQVLDDDVSSPLCWSRMVMFK